MERSSHNVFLVNTTHCILCPSHERHKVSSSIWALTHILILAFMVHTYPPLFSRDEGSIAGGSLHRESDRNNLVAR
ncbi:hypothetical protein BJX62DRAFT_203591 [Aspergillus germanicus]